MMQSLYTASTGMVGMQTQMNEMNRDAIQKLAKRA